MGLFSRNYSKPGPGVGKNEPQKKTIVVFFETYFRNFWKLVVASLAYTLCSLPVVTYGLASVGMTKITRNIARGKHSFGMSDFLETVGKNWKQALPAGIINTLLLLLVAFDFSFFRGAMQNANGIDLSTVGFGITFFILLITSIMKYYIWVMMITFRFSLWKLYKNSFRFAILNLWKNLLLALLLALFYVAGFFLVVYTGVIGILVVFFFGVCIFPGFKSLMVQYFVFPSVRKYMIDPYYAEHPDDDIELRRSLGLLPDDYGIDDSVFSDEALLPPDPNDADK